MDDTLMSEEYEEGEAWKNRENTTYNSLLDINGVTDLFSQERTDQYNDRKQESVSLYFDKDKCRQKKEARGTCS